MENEDIKTQVAEGIAEGVKSALASLPAVKAQQTIVVTEAEGDRKFRSLADQARAVKQDVLSMGRNTHPRLAALKSLELDAMKASGASEGVPADGGYLLEPTLVSEVMKPMHEEGPFTRSARRLPVSANSNYGWLNGVDETSRVTGSRWGGIQGYRLNEGGTKTASKPKFRRINWELKKYAAVVYGTDELLADAAMFSEVVNTGCREELVFMANDDVLNGSGVGGPQGILQSGALVGVTRTDANKVQHADIVAMWQRMSPRSKANAAWYINSEVHPQLDALYFPGSTTSVLSPYVSYGQDGVMRIYGRPVIETEFNPALGTQGDILLADMREYLFWEKTNIEAATSIHVQFLTDETTFRFVYRCDGQTSMSSPITPYKGTLTQSGFISLTAAT
jgi:HK97 family phage major capsid protein